MEDSVLVFYLERVHICSINEINAAQKQLKNLNMNCTFPRISYMNVEELRNKTFT